MLVYWLVVIASLFFLFFFFQAEDGIRDLTVTGVQTCALPIYTIECARVAAARGCDVILFTDPWLSPASAFARQVLVTSVETVGPFDSLVGATAVVEALIAAVLRQLGPRAEARMQSLERLRSGGVLGGNDSA